MKLNSKTKNFIGFVSIAALVFLSTLSIGAEVTPVVDLKPIIGQPKSVVEDKLGKAKSCSPSKYGEKCSFSTGETEILFIKGKADWITVNGLKSAPYSQYALALLGLSPISPTYSNANVLRWSNITGIMEVSIFPAGSGVDYAYVKVSTK
jgi:hypothetical protein